MNPSLFLASNGFKISINGDTGAFLPVEVGVTVGRQSGYLGTYRAGGYYDTSTVTGVNGQLTRFLPPGSPTALALPQTMVRGRSGFWLLADQTVERDGPDSKRGLVLFGGLEYGDRQTALVRWFGEAGLLRQGTFAGRDEDTLALGFAIADINGRARSYEASLQRMGVLVGKTAQEWMVELNYGAQLTPWLNLRPGLQYIWHPGGQDELRNALVLDFKTLMNF